MIDDDSLYGGGGGSAAHHKFPQLSIQVSAISSKSIICCWCDTSYLNSLEPFKYKA